MIPLLDITYESLGKAFGQKLVYHEETLRRLNEATKYRKWTGDQTAEQLTARNRMALFPENAEVIYVAEDIWVVTMPCFCSPMDCTMIFPKACSSPSREIMYFPWNSQPVHQNAAQPDTVHSASSKERTTFKNTNLHRVCATFLSPCQFHSGRDFSRPESMIAPYLTSLQKRLKPHDIQVGSYPILFKGVFVSLIGRDLQHKNKDDPNAEGRVWLAEVAQEVEREIGGRIVSDEEVAAQKSGTISLETSNSAGKKIEPESVKPSGEAQASASEEGGKAKF